MARSGKQSLRMEKGQQELDILFYTYQEEGMIITYSPALELSGMGHDAKESMKDLLGVINITFEYATEKGTLDKMLLELSWKKINETTLEAPDFSDDEIRNRIKVYDLKKYEGSVALSA